MYICKNCSYSTISKLGKCPECGRFGTFEEKKGNNDTKNIGVKLQSFINNENKFFDLDSVELKRVFTNGIKKAGVYLLGGQPGIGKSTIVLQIINSLKENIKIGYFSGEEDSSAINFRFKRLFKKDPNFNIYHTTSLEDILKTIDEENLDLIILDSIQTVYSSEITGVAGSANQVKYCSEQISDFCKKQQVSSIIIGHITKSGEIAGPKYLEHIVDVVAYLEGDRFSDYRFLRTQKNRFGNTSDVAIFQMTENGLLPVYDLKDKIKENLGNTPGTLLTVGIDNGRPVITVMEVLLNKTKYKFPKRSSIGVDSSRVEMIIAILERYLKLNLEFVDIFINIPGEFKFYDSGLDLAIAVGIISAYKNKLVPQNNIFLGEIGLSGKVNKSKFHNKRVQEANGFDIIDYMKVKNITNILELI